MSAIEPKPAIAVWKVNDCDWVMARSAEEAKEVLATITDVYEEDEVRALTDHELDTFKLIDEDHDEETDGPHPTFRQELERRVAAVGMFASKEY